MMDTYIVSKLSNISIPTESTIIYIEDGLNIAPLASDFIFVDKSLSPGQKKAIIERLGLFANVITLQKDDTKIILISGFNLNKDVSYSTTTSGSLAQDVLAHATLDVEKIARIAYEKTNHNLLNVDNADSFASSNIWRKVVNNINEDYDTINLMNILVEDFFIYFSNKYEELESIVVDTNFKNIVLKNIIQCGFKITENYFTNDFGIIAKLI